MEHKPDFPSDPSFAGFASNADAFDPLAARAQLRRERLAAREALSPADHSRLSVAIAIYLARYLAESPPAILGFCWPYRAEFDVRPLAIRLHQQGWQACLPLVSTPQAPLSFRAWQPDSAMLTDRYGIAYPAVGASLIPQVLLLPFNVMDKQGYRLGYGAGYFDRTLEAMTQKHQRPYVIGVGFGLGMVETTWPQPHDIPVDCMVTEDGVHSINSSGR